MVMEVRKPYSTMYRLFTVMLVMLTLISYIVISAAKINYLVIIASICVGISYGILSNVVAARHLYFLAAASPHSALFAASLGMIIYMLVGGNPRYWSVIIGITLLNVVSYLIRVSRSKDVATSVFVSLTSSLSVVTLYYLSMVSNVSRDALMSVIVGELTLVSREYVVEATLITAAIVIPVIIMYYGMIYEPKVTTSVINKYDIVMYTILALATVGLIKLTGFILEHVLILMPGAIASTVARKARDALAISLLTSLAATSLGLLIYVPTGMSPSGMAGVFLVSTYVVSILLRRKRGRINL